MMPTTATGKGGPPTGALRKIWRELDEGYEWVVDADLADFFGSVDHEKLLELVNQRVSDGRVLGLLRQMLRAGVVADGRRLPTDQGTPQGGIVSPLLSNILLTPFDWEMRRRGYRLTRYADDWLITCRNTRGSPRGTGGGQADTGEAGCDPEHRENPYCPCSDTGSSFSATRSNRASGLSGCKPRRSQSGVRGGARYAVPREKSIRHFKDQIRKRTRRKAPVSTQELIDQINPVIRGWGQYYCKAHVRKLFHQLDGWIVRRIWSHRRKRWRNVGWKQLPTRKLIDEYGLVRLITLVPSLNLR